MGLVVGEGAMMSGLGFLFLWGLLATFVAVGFAAHYHRERTFRIEAELMLREEEDWSIRAIKNTEMAVIEELEEQKQRGNPAAYREPARVLQKQCAYCGLKCLHCARKEKQNVRVMEAVDE